LKGWKTKIGKREVVRRKIWEWERDLKKKKKRLWERDLEGRSKEEKLSTSNRSLKKVFQDKCKLSQNRWKLVLVIFSYLIMFNFC